MSLTSLVFLIISAFMFVPLFLAEIARRKSYNLGVDFFIEQRRMGSASMYFTVYATWMSAFAYMGAITYFYEQGPVYMTTVGWDALFAVLFYVFGRRIWFYGKKNHYLTPTEFFSDIYKNQIFSNIVTAMTLVFTMIYIEVQLVGGLYLVQSASNGMISWQVAGGIFFIIMITYLWAGGIRAVALTDVFYGAMIIVTVFASGFYLIHSAGGVEHVFDALALRDPTAVSLAGENRGNRTLLWLSLFVIVPIGAFMGPQMWIRNYAAKSEKNFEKLPFFLALSSVVFIGTLFAGSVCVLLHPEEINPEMLLGAVMMEKANPVFATFIFLGVAAAIFSTANSQVHAMSVVYTVDVHKRMIRTNISDRKMVVVAKRSIVVFSVISYLILALVTRNLMNVGFYALGGLTQLFVPLVGAFFWKRSTGTAAIVSVCSGLAAFLLFGIILPTDSSICAIIGLFINAVLFVVISLLCKPDHRTEQTILDYKNAFDTQNHSSKKAEA